MRYAFILTLFALISGCVSTPETLEFNNARTYNKPQEEVWQKLVQYFDTSSIPIKTQDKEKGVLVAVRKLKRASIYVECGTSDISSVRDGILTVKVSLQSLEESKTRATIIVTFSGYRLFAGLTKNRIQCFSNGTLEEEVLKNL